MGWNYSLHTLFAHVLNTAANKEGDDRTIPWIGGEFGVVSDPATVVEAVRPFATIPVELAQTLRSERTASVQSMSTIQPGTHKAGSWIFTDT